MLYFSVVLLDKNVEHDDRDLPMGNTHDEEDVGSFQRFPESSSRTSLVASTSKPTRQDSNEFIPRRYDNSSDDSSFSPSPPPAYPSEGRKRKAAQGILRRESSYDDDSYSSSLRSPSPYAGSSTSESTRSRSSTPPTQNSQSFTRVVMTKFSHPPGYRAKKVKFHTCTECGKAFPRPSGLRTHMNTHTKAKPYPCTFEGCDKTFSVISNAKRHYRTHLTGPAPDPFGSSGPFIVDFSEPVVLDALPPSSSSSSSSSSGSDDIGGGGRASPSTSISSSDSVSPSPCVRLGRNEAPTVSLKWLPPGADTRRSLYTPVCQKGAMRQT